MINLLIRLAVCPSTCPWFIPSHHHQLCLYYQHILLAWCKYFELVFSPPFSSLPSLSWSMIPKHLKMLLLACPPLNEKLCNYIKYELFPQHVGHPWCYFPLPLTVQLSFQSCHLNKVIGFSLEVSMQTVPHQWVPSVPPSIPKDTCSSSLISSSFKLLLLMSCVLYFEFLFLFSAYQIHFNFPEDKWFSFYIPSCYLAKSVATENAW